MSFFSRTSLIIFFSENHIQTFTWELRKKRRVLYKQHFLSCFLNFNKVVCVKIRQTVHTQHLIIVQWNLGSRTPLITNKSVHERLSSRTNRFTNASLHEQIGSRTPLITNKSFHERLSSRTNRFTNASFHEQISSRTPLFTNKFSEQKTCRLTVSRVTNMQAGNNIWRQAGSIGGRASAAV
jgi:hypothetical protein